MDHVEEIKQKLDIVNIIGEYLELKKAGSNFKGRCPFHNEKTPSFVVSPDRQMFHCFGCGEGGDMFTFIQKQEGLEFPEALRILANKAGVEIERFDPRVTSQKNRLIEVCEATTEFWQRQLKESSGEKASDYIVARKLTSETIESFKLGYAPESWDLTMKYLHDAKFNETEIFKAGLTVKKDRGTGYYDRFRDRIIFPIQDVHANVVGFTGRTMKEDEGAKYINTPEGPIYHKSKVLYGLDKAKQAIREAKYVVVVEGNMDVITAHQAGYKNVVACSGTALTIDQILLIKRFTDNVALCFDSDDAGQMAAKRSIDLLYEAEVNIKIVELVKGKDPDECINLDVKAWEQSLREAKTAMQYYFDKHLTNDNLDNISKKKEIVKLLLQEINKLKDKIEQDHWLKKLAQILQVEARLLWESLPQAKSNLMKTRVVAPEQKDVQSSVKVDKSRDVQLLERVLTIIINHPKLIGYAQEYLLPDHMIVGDLKTFYKNLILYYNEDKQGLSQKTINQRLETETQEISQSYLNSLILNIEEAYEEFSDEQIRQELIELIIAYKKYYFEQQIKNLNSQLAVLESQNDAQVVEDHLKKIIAFSEQLALLK